MDTEQKALIDLHETLVTFGSDKLRVLLDSCEVQFDGRYLINAAYADYTQLLHYYPLLESHVHEKLGKHLHLNLLPHTVPMGTVGQDDSEELRLSIEIGANSVSDAIMQPESIVAVPSYLLRFVPYVGAGPVLIATALRQAFYRASRENGADQLYPKQGDSVKIDVRSLLNSLGGAMSRASYFRIFKDGGMDWFVERGAPKHRVEEGQVRREANTYYYRGVLLTPGDACDLFEWLRASDLQKDPIGTLTRLIETPRDQILQFPFRVPDAENDQGFDRASSIHEVIEAAYGKGLDPTLAGLADRIAHHLVRPESFLAVPWYWFRKVLPELGLDLGMLYLMSKNCCYVDWAHGRDRDSFWVPGGLKTLQAWIRSETLPKRIPHAEPSRRGRPRKERINEDSAYTRNWRESKRQLASDYLLRIDTRQSETGTDWKLRVKDVQLTTADESLKQAIYGFIYAPPAKLESLPMQDLMQNAGFKKAMLANGKTKSAQLCHFETLVAKGICQIETLNLDLICHFDTLVDGINYYFETLVKAGICQYETVLNILFKLKYTSLLKQNNLNQPHTFDLDDDDDDSILMIGPMNNPTTLVVVKEPNEDEPWDYKALFSILDPRFRAQIRVQELENVVVAWAIQGCFLPIIKDPWSLAISKANTLKRGPGGSAERLASLPFNKLKDFVMSTLFRMEADYFNPTFLSQNGGQDLVDMLETLGNVEDKKRALRRFRDAFRFNEDN